MSIKKKDTPKFISRPETVNTNPKIATAAMRYYYRALSVCWVGRGSTSSVGVPFPDSIEIPPPSLWVGLGGVLPQMSGLPSRILLKSPHPLRGLGGARFLPIPYLHDT